MAYTEVEQNRANAASVDAGGNVRDYIALLKPRVMSLVVFTAFVGMVIAPGGINWILGAASLFAIAIGAGAAGSLNMWYDADIDRIMRRTITRPVPAGRLDGSEALGIGIVLAVGSVTFLGLASNYVAAGLLAFTIFFYAVVYTMWLKRWTPQNIVIGGAAGALPPVVGWAVVTGDVSMESLALFMIIFLWTPPHFWALSLYKSDDYQRAGIPMMPVVKGVRRTKIEIVAYSVVLAVFASLAPYLLGMATLAYAIIAGGLGAVFVLLSLKVFQMPEDDSAMKPARHLFTFSMLYLFLLFAILLAESGLARFVS